MKAASPPGGTCPHKKEHRPAKDLQKEKVNETTQGMERSIGSGRERASWLSPYLFLCLDKNIGETGGFTPLHLLLAMLLTLLYSPHPSRVSLSPSLSFFSLLGGMSQNWKGRRRVRGLKRKNYKGI